MMRRTFLSALVAATAGLALKGAPAAAQNVIAAPPPPQVEAVPVAPGPAYVWIPGHWRWNGVRYVWIRGHYRRGPRPGAVWVNGFWSQMPSGRWRWVPGHWAYR